MSLEELRRNWNAFGRKDPFWAILTDPKKKGNKWQAEEFFETGVSEIKYLMDHIESLGVHIPRRKALDFGCGVGRLTQALAGYFGEVHGVDIAPSMIELAIRYNRYGDRCKYHLNNSASLELFADDSFDLIYSRITLQHIQPEYSKGYISEFVRVLAPSGLLIFSLPSHLVNPGNSGNPNSIKQRVKGAMPPSLLKMYRRIRYGPVMFAYGIDRQEVVTVLERNSAKIIEISQNEDGGKAWISYRYCATKL